MLGPDAALCVDVVGFVSKRLDYGFYGSRDNKYIVS